jgi:8-oxo-dGTP pyrophosphatase MutT (NUDIX family)
MPSLWECPSGSIEPGETALQAMVRETFEETGLVASNLAEKQFFDLDDGITIWRIHPFYLLSATRKILLSPAEHD